MFYLRLSVRLFVSLLDYSKSYERILMKFLEGWRAKTSRLGFGGNPYRDPDLFTVAISIG